MLKVQETYQERIGQLIYVLKELEEIMWESFPPAAEAGLHDLSELRTVVGKAEEILQLCQNHGNMRRMRDEQPPSAS